MLFVVLSEVKKEGGYLRGKREGNGGIYGMGPRRGAGFAT